MEENEQTNPLKSSLFSIVEPLSTSSESAESMLITCQVYSKIFEKDILAILSNSITNTESDFELFKKAI